MADMTKCLRILLVQLAKSTASQLGHDISLLKLNLNFMNHQHFDLFQGAETHSLLHQNPAHIESAKVEN